MRQNRRIFPAWIHDVAGIRGVNLRQCGNVKARNPVVAWFVQRRITAISRTRSQDAPAVRWLYNANNNQESNTRT